MHQSTQRFVSWIACFAILLASFAPTISHALMLAKHADASWVEICSVGSAKVIKVADANPAKSPDSSDPASHAKHLEHCPFCSPHAGSFALPPAAAFVLPVQTAVVDFPRLYYQAPRRLFIWAAAQSRAPPAIS